MPKTVKSETEAKQGRKGVPVLKVLIFGIILAMIAWFGAELFFPNSQSEMVPDAAVQSEDPAS